MEQSKFHENGQLDILIVEDESMIALELEMMIKDLGHRVVGIAAKPQQAISLIASLGPGIDGVFLDANLAGQSAVPVAERLRECDIPFVVVSGYSFNELIKLGFDRSGVQKPYGSRQIEQALKNFGTGGASAQPC